MIYQMRKEVMCTPLLSSITRDILGLGSDKAMIRHRVGCVRMQQTGAFSFFFLKISACMQNSTHSEPQDVKVMPRYLWISNGGLSI